MRRRSGRNNRQYLYQNLYGEIIDGGFDGWVCHLDIRMDKVSPRGSQRVPVPLKRVELRREIPDLKTLRRSVAGDCRLMGGQKQNGATRHTELDDHVIVLRYTRT